MKIRFFGQNILQIIGLLYATVAYRREAAESADSYVPKTKFMLPFHGEWYTANGGVTLNTSHSWEILPQRYAYDFFILDQEGRSCQGDPKDLHSYYCYGKDVLAPADGKVISVKNRFPDCRIMDDGMPDPDATDIAGNRIIIKHSANEYSAICHLKPGSVTVRKGQQVKQGDPIAKCGNTGNTTEPHIHFQVQNSARFYASMGVPVRFDNIQKEGYPNYHLVDPRPWPDAEDIKGDYIYRGLLVQNVDTK